MINQQILTEISIFVRESAIHAFVVVTHLALYKK